MALAVSVRSQGIMMDLTENSIRNPVGDRLQDKGLYSLNGKVLLAVAVSIKDRIRPITSISPRTQ